TPPERVLGNQVFFSISLSFWGSRNGAFLLPFSFLETGFYLLFSFSKLQRARLLGPACTGRLATGVALAMRFTIGFPIVWGACAMLTVLRLLLRVCGVEVNGRLEHKHAILSVAVLNGDRTVALETYRD